MTTGFAPAQDHAFAVGRRRNMAREGATYKAHQEQVYRVPAF